MNIYVTLRDDHNKILEDKTKLVVEDNLFDTARMYARAARDRYESGLIAWEIFLRHHDVYCKLVNQSDLEHIKECLESMENMIGEMKRKFQ